MPFSGPAIYGLKRAEIRTPEEMDGRWNSWSPPALKSHPGRSRRDSLRQGFVTRKRIKRAVAAGTGVLSRTTSCAGVFVSVTVFGGPEFQPAIRLLETSTM